MVQLDKAGLDGNTGHAGISQIESPVVLKKKIILESSGRLRTVLGVVLLADGKRDVAILDHVLDLLAHGQEEEDEPVHNQDRPENWHVKDLEPTAGEADDDGSGGPVPKLELGKSADEGLELLIALGRQSAYRAILHIIVGLFIGRIEFGLQESKEQVQKVNAERIGNNVPALGNQDSQEEKHKADNCADPSVENERG
jgi:hypothetical protein